MSDTIPTGVQMSMTRVRQLLGKEPTPVDEGAEKVRKAIADAQAMLLAEDVRMRSEVLPEPPDGYFWHCWIENSRNPEGVLGRVQMHLCYRLEPNP